MPDRTATARPASLVWIDSEVAILARLEHDPLIERIESNVPPHRHAMGHVHINPQTRHGGGGPVEDRVEAARNEKLREFVATVARRLPPTDDVWILGPGVVREHLERWLLDEDRRHHRPRTVHVQSAGHLTERQLVARLRGLAGLAPRRRAPASTR